MSRQGSLLPFASLMLAFSPCSAQPVDRNNQRAQAFVTPFFFQSGKGYVSTARDETAYFLTDRVVYKVRGVAFQVEFLGGGANVGPQGEVPQVGRVNYLIGSQPSDWSTDRPTYKELVYHGIYSGIDARFGFADSLLKSEFVIAPGGDPTAVRLRYTGLGSPQIDLQGDLRFASEHGEFFEKSPTAFQMRGTTRVEIPARFTISVDGSVGFSVGAFDPTLALIIDPLVAYSSYIGGHGDSVATAVAVDPSGNVYVAGWTDSQDLKVTSPFQRFNAGSVDAFVLKLNPAGNTLLYATYIGGTGDDRAYGIAVDSAGNAVLTGSTTSSNFPTHVPIQSGLLGSRDAFVLKLNAAGNSLTFSTYLGGAGQETGYGVALDSQGNAYVTGDTNSSNFPTKTPFQVSNNGGQDAFVVKMSSAGVLTYGTYLGGSGNEHATAIAVDSAGSAYITGGTFSSNFPIANAFQAANAGGQDAFVTKLGSAGNSLGYSTYLGGSGGALGSPEWGAGIAVDSAGHAFVTGSTSSANFPIVVAVQPLFGGGTSNAFVAEFTPLGTSLLYSTYFGGSTMDYGDAIAVDLAGNAYIAGYTGSVDMPVVGAAQAASAGSYDAFVLILNSTGSAVDLATYYGGSMVDAANGIAVDLSGNVYVAGQTSSSNFPLVAAFQPAMLGSLDAFILKLQPALAQPNFSLNMSPSSATVAQGGNATYSLTVTAINSFNGTVSFAVQGLPAGVTGSFSPTTVTGSGSTTLTITASASAPLGNYTATVNATSGQLNHSGSAALIVAAKSTATAAFVKVDAATEGNWKGVYGSDGYVVIGDLTLNPSYVTPAASGQGQVNWSGSTTDVRALQKASNPADRIAGVWYTATSFTVDLNITDSNTHQVAVYCLDWDRLGRAETVAITDANGIVLNSQSESNFGGGVYVVWNVSGHVKIQVTLTGGPNGVATGLFFGGGTVSGSGTAAFVKQDAVTQGNWQGVYGRDGYLVIGDLTLNPSYVTPAATGQGQVIWSSSTTDVRALQKASNPSDRIAGVWYTATSFTVDLNITDGNTHQVAVYCLDWDRLGRAETVAIRDANGNVLNSQSESNFGGGVYVVWNVSGHVKIQVTLTGGPNGVATGLFFGGGTVSGSGTAAFVKQDAVTQGNWQGVYGRDGYLVIGDLTLNPSYVTPAATGQGQVIWSSSTTDVRALQKASNSSDRIAGVWYTFTSFTVDLNITDSNTHQVAVYCLDWDRLGRAETVAITDANGNVLNSQSESNFGGGVYVVWNVSGHVKIQVTLTGGPNAVATGLFFR